MGEIDIIIDELTPCLLRTRDNKEIDTYSEQHFGEFLVWDKGLDFNIEDYEPVDEYGIIERDYNMPRWSWKEERELFPNASFFELFAYDDVRPQGRICLNNDRIELVEAAPWNNSYWLSDYLKNNQNKEYIGVGGHLFALAVQERYNKGESGELFFRSIDGLQEHYQESSELLLLQLLEDKRWYYQKKQLIACGRYITRMILMFNKPAYTDKKILFSFPMHMDQREEAIAYIDANGLDEFISHSNIEYYAPNILPLNKSTYERLSHSSSEKSFDDIARYIERSSSLWSNPVAEATQNQAVHGKVLGYKVDNYGSGFLQGNMDELKEEAIRFPLLEEEMFIVLNIIEKRGIKFFVEHCAPDGLPDCPYIRDTIDDTIANFESLVKWYGSYWLLGQLNDAAILNIKKAKKEES